MYLSRAGASNGFQQMFNLERQRIAAIPNQKMVQSFVHPKENVTPLGWVADNKGLHPVVALDAVAHPPNSTLRSSFKSTLYSNQFQGNLHNQ